jgi:glycolate oxidase FAD binding subunit
VRVLDGKGEDLRFGGQVMKNVAGYDVSRLMAGSLGTLGVLTEVSLKVLPAPPAERRCGSRAATPRRSNR